jgi:radical SAM superfamily enzyme
VQRLVSEAHRDILVAPEWLKDKSAIIREIEDTLESRSTRQGAAL